jgi:hypothetical protein
MTLFTISIIQNFICDLIEVTRVVHPSEFLHKQVFRDFVKLRVREEFGKHINVEDSDIVNIVNGYLTIHPY